MSEMLDSTVRAALRRPFPKEQISTLPGSANRPPLDYVGHAAVTDRLIEAAPDWTYTLDKIIEADGHVAAVIGTMTIGGVARVEVGDVDKRSTYGQEMKLAISDFIRRAAMRFGVAIDLWSKEELSGASVPSAQPRTAGSLGDGTESAGPGAEPLPSPGSAPSSASGAGAEGKIQVDNKADSPSASPAAPSEVVDKGVEPVSFGKGGPGSAPDLLAKAAELYGSPSRVLRAARMLHDFNTVEEIDAATLAGLIARKSA